jgi:hypothetical protein
MPNLLDTAPTVIRGLRQKAEDDAIVKGPVTGRGNRAHVTSAASHVTL